MVISPEGAAVSIGFNNAYQTVSTPNGAQHFIWVEGSRVVHGRLASGSRELETSPLAEGRTYLLTAMAAAGDLLVTGWTEQTGRESSIVVRVSGDAGTSWAAPFTLETGGTGLSLAADGDSAVATWQIGDEERSEVHFARWDGSTGSWSTPTRVDESSAAPLWAAVELVGERVWVTWRDNRDRPAYRIYLRRSEDGGRTWRSEQEILPDMSGDPSICAAPNGVTWLAHHGQRKITVWRSADGGASFDEPVAIGQGWFARISCADDGSMIVGWEQSSGTDPKETDDKQAVVVVGDANGELGERVVLREQAGTTASVSVRGDGYADVVWVEPAPDAGPMVGQLQYTVVEMPR
jgi:hypothetical protein